MVTCQSVTINVVGKVNAIVQPRTLCKLLWYYFQRENLVAAEAWNELRVWRREIAPQ